MKYGEILNWLWDRGFEAKYSEKFHPHFVLLKKNQINVILKEYISATMYHQIRSDAVDIRSKLNKLDENVSNTYFLVCTKDEFETFPYSIEKDSVGLRKYVIKSYSDFKRIPFLDKIDIEEQSGKNVNVKMYSEQNGHLNNVIEYIHSREGFQRKLEKKEINEILSKFYNIEVENDES